MLPESQMQTQQQRWLAMRMLAIGIFFDGPASQSAFQELKLSQSDAFLPQFLANSVFSFSGS